MFFGVAGTSLTVSPSTLFLTRIRALGAGLPYPLTVADFGGTVEYIALRLEQGGAAGAAIVRR
jgi:MHS family alpha-ketoglutarate permease-like MFS transporter